MILKNEAPRMPRLLDTLKGLIDEVVISDTGSTDDTIEVTRKKCEEMGLPFFADQTPFKDFGFNRSRSITVAVEKSKCDFLLFLDADMKLARGPKFSKRLLLTPNADVLSLMQAGCGLEYYNMRIMRRTLPGLRCVGVTHEHYTSDGQTSTTNVPPDIMFIDDIGDGGAKADKFERDYRLLTQGLKDEPDNVRYMFYLAETCRHEGKMEESIKLYKRRIKAGGWDEEIYRSYYGITLCYIGMGNAMKADTYALRSFFFRPCRIEGLYAVCKWHRERGENEKAYWFFLLGHRVLKPDDVLFVEMVPYTWGWDYEFSILAYYVERKSTLLRHPMGSINCLRRIITSIGTADMKMPSWAHDGMVENTKHYIELLPSQFPRTDMMPNLIKSYHCSTPGVVRLNGYPNLIRYARQVDYRIVKANGQYLLGPGGKIRSTCSINLGRQWSEIRVDPGSMTRHADATILGIEDIRFFNMGDGAKVYGLGTSQEYAEGSQMNQMILIEVNLEKLTAIPIKKIPRVFSCEKNHAPIQGTDLCVHSWGPRFRVYDLLKTGKEIVWTHEFPEHEVPGWFRSIRGSSAGIPWPSTGTPREYWFVCHTVFHETPRRYVHNVVRLDVKTLRPVGFTVPFSFDEYKIEFVGGIAFDDNDQTLVVGYSIFDSTSREIRIPVAWLLQVMMVNIMNVQAPAPKS